jgi:hypothetical protein
MSDQENFNQKQGDPFENYNGYGGHQPIPNSVAVLVLGIVSIALCWCYGLVSIITGIVAIVLANQAERIYKANPQQFSVASYKNLKAGKICGIIGLCLGVLYLIFIVIYIALVGTLAFGGFNRLGM